VEYTVFSLIKTQPQMTKNYLAFSRSLKLALFSFLLIIASTQVAKACHGTTLLSLTGTVSATDITINGNSDPSTCGCGPYWMQVEVTCDPNGFTGNPPVPTSASWGTPPWYHSNLNIANQFNDQCILEDYQPISIPFSALCSGTTYYWRAREWVEGDNSAGPWSNPQLFTTPGLPPSAILSSTASAYMVCPGDTIQLNAAVVGGCPGAVFTYSWAPAGGLSNANIANPTAIVSGPTIYTVTVTGGCFTITSNDDTVQIFQAPSVSPGTPTAMPTSVCSGGSSLIVLTGNGSNNIQWQVSPNATSWFNIPGATNDSLNTGSLTSSLYYHAIVTGTGWPGSGCGTSVSPPVLVTVNPAPVANAGLDATVCTGGCTNLSGTGGVSYNWNPGNQNTQSISACPSSNTIYTLTVTDANGCTATDNVAVNISTTSVTASPNVTICTGGNTILLATGPSGNTFSWSPAGSLTGANTANPTAAPPVTTTYTVTSTNSFGCTATDSVTVIVTSAPPLIVSNDTSFCAGGSATLTASGAATYLWNPGNVSGSSIVVNPNATITYTVTGHNGNCVSKDSVIVTINPPPAAFAGPDFAICNGAQATLGVATTGASYLWTPSAGIVGSNTTQNVVIDPTSTSNYTVTVVLATGCFATDVVTVSVNPGPTVSATSPDNTICIGSGTTLNASGASNYTWLPAVGLGAPNSGTTGANPGTTTTYQVVGTDVNGCTDTASITVVVNPLPNVYMTSSPTECGDTAGAITMGGVVAGDAPFIYQIGNQTYGSLPINNLQAGNYNVTITDANGCVSSGTVNVGMINSSFVNAAASPTFGVYPLPVVFTSSGSSGLDNWHWDFGDGIGNANSPSAGYTYPASGTYQVVLTAWNDWFGCAVYDTLYITVVEAAVINLPNVFTPNGDGTNDGFDANISGVKDIKVEIYNRWGGQVYSGSQTGISSGPQVLQLWDGKANSGNASEDGVYYYVVTATGYDEKEYPFTGFVQLMKTKPGF
jgi:gliding motility-associated-like protein